MSRWDWTDVVITALNIAFAVAVVFATMFFLFYSFECIMDQINC